VEFGEGFVHVAHGSEEGLHLDARHKVGQTDALLAEQIQEVSSFLKNCGPFLVLRLWRDRRDIEAWEALHQRLVEVNEVGEATHALDGAQRVTAGHWILVVVAEGVLNQLRRSDV